jgi:hypothetical protein
MTHLDISNTSYGQKKGRESNCQFNSQPLKVENRPISLREGGMPHTIGKLSMKDTTLLWISIQLEVHTQSYGPPKLGKVAEVPTLGISGLPLGSPGTK